MKAYKKLFAETQVTTTHMLKNCSKVPKIYTQYDQLGKLVNNDKYTPKDIERFRTSIFQRGSMRFDDVNYDLYNQFILIDPNYDSDDEELVQSLKGFVPAKVQQKKSLIQKDGQFDDGVSVALTINNVYNQSIDEYDHDILNTLT